MSEDQRLADAALGEYLPEWSISQEAYQPPDIGSMSSNISLLKNKLGLVDDWVLAILNGTFDYGLLEPVSSFDEAAPDTATSDVYRNSGKYDVMFQALDEAETPKSAALAQFFAETGEKVDETEEKGPPRYMDLVAMAEKVAGEVYAKSAWEARRDAAVPVKSEMAKALEAAGLSSELTQDSYFSDSIDKDRESLDQVAAELQKASALSNSPLDTAGGEFESDVNPYMAEYIATLNRDEPGGTTEDFGPVSEDFSPVSAGTGANSEARADVPPPQGGGARWTTADRDEAVSQLRSEEEQFKADLLARMQAEADAGYPGTPYPESGQAPSVAPSPQSADFPPFAAQPPAKLMPGLQQFAEEMEARRAGGVLGGAVGGAAPTVPSTIPSQNMQVPFNPETHYAPANTLPDFNGPRGGMPRNAAPSDEEVLKLAEGMTDGGFMRILGDFFNPQVEVEHPDSFESGALPGGGIFEGLPSPFKWIKDDVVGPWVGDKLHAIERVLGDQWVYQQLGGGNNGGGNNDSKNESWKGDPRDKRSQVGKAADWDYRKKLFDEGVESRRSIASKENTRRIGATNDAVRRHVGQEFLTNLEQQRIDRARAAGGSIQQDMLLTRLLGLPRA